MPSDDAMITDLIGDDKVVAAHTTGKPRVPSNSASSTNIKQNSFIFSTRHRIDKMPTSDIFWIIFLNLILSKIDCTPVTKGRAKFMTKSLFPEFAKENEKCLKFLFLAFPVQNLEPVPGLMFERPSDEEKVHEHDIIFSKFKRRNR
jgi:hypothetical protein